jgi:D-alanine-D-alanine ligase
MDEDSDRTDLPVLMIYDLNWKWTQTEIDFVIDKINRLEPALRKLGHPLWVERIDDPDLVSRLEKYNPDEVIIFNLCEELPGIPHSSSQVAQILEERGFTHSGAVARNLANNQDKLKVKHQLEKWNIPNPAWRIYRSLRLKNWELFPAIVKPSLEHCSIGVSGNSVVNNADELRQQVKIILDTFSQPVLVEEFIDGREFRVSVWGNQNPVMLPPAEMDYSLFHTPQEHLLSYESKIDPTSIYYRKIGVLQPPSLTVEEYSVLERIAIDSYRASGCRDYGGIDVRLCDGKFYVLDVNADPEIAPNNSMTHGAELLGYDYGRQGSRIINLAARRHPIFSKLYKKT